MNLIPLNFITHGEQTPLRRMMLEKALAGGGGLSEYEVTGNPVAFNTNLARPLSAFTIPFLPTQSGTGDPSPENVRPISGWTGVTAYRTGVNLFDEQYPDIKSGSTLTYRAIYVGNSAVTGSTDAPWVDGQYANLFLLPGSVQTGASSGLNDISPARERTVTPVDGYVTIAYRNYGNVNPADYHVQIEVGETPSPYAEYTGESYPVTFPATGKNLLNPAIFADRTSFYTIESNGSITVKGSDFTAWASIEFTEMKAGTYTFSYFGESGEISFKKESTYADTYHVTPNNPVTFTMQEGEGIKVKAGIGAESYPLTVQIQLEAGSTATSYEPFTNTIYGGTLDAVNGVLTVEWCILDLKWSAFRIRTDLGDNIRGAMYITQNLSTPGGKGGLCNIAKHSWDYSKDRVHFYTDNNLAFIFVPEGTSEDTNIQIVYPLATPYEIQLDPITVQTLKGDNTVWTDTNGENTVKYLKKG
jgi:hypothetical protein